MAAVTAANNAANAANAPVHDVNLEFNDWTDNSNESKDITINTNPLPNTLPFPSNVSLPTEPIPPSVNTDTPGIVTSSNSFTTTSTNFINQNTEPYTSSHSADQKPSLWSADDATISNLMMSAGSLPSTTLDLSPLDIKWGILDQEPSPIKREQDKPLDSLPNNI